MFAQGLLHIGTAVGALACQRDPYLATLRTKVVARETSADADSIVLADSPLFPEGGGQPCDHGTIAKGDRRIPVTRVTRHGDTCVLTVPVGELTEGDEVDVDVDVDRRRDHMHHHTAQHLLTAVLERELRLPTMSWSLTHPACFVQLPTAAVDPADVARVENLCNGFIAQRIDVTTTTFASRDDVPPARSRGIPADVGGPIRIVGIGEIDACTCCGTHVKNLAELQLIKLLHQEAKGNTTRLFFVAGRRAVEKFSEMYQRERALTKEVGTAPEGIVAMVARRAAEAAQAQKTIRKLRAEVATMLAPAVQKDAAATPEGRVFFFFREDADNDFINTVGQGIERPAVLGGGVGEDGIFVIRGPPDVAARILEVASAEMGAKGAASKNLVRGKCNAKQWKKFVKQVELVMTGTK